MRIDNGGGILFMVDMGSLMDFGDRIASITGIKTATIGSVSTPNVLEAVSKSFLFIIYPA
ncbi:MAG: hypothetical protein QME46_07610 [Thermoanaerobacteraceae bacterium]|nr:hypothetical protein [Thermoanaerobacteraceae bacterium]